MANKRESSAQRRQRENRARRAALEARKGAPSRPSRVAPATAERLARSTADAKGASGKTGSKADPKATTKSGKPRREKPPKPGDTPVDIATLEGSWFKKVIQVPGGLQALMGVALVIFVTGMLSFTSSYVPENAPKDAKPSLTIFERFSAGQAVLILAVPLLASVFAAGASLTKWRRRGWLLAAFAVALGVSVSTLYLFVAGTFGWAVFRASKIEGPDTPLLRRSKQRAEAEAEAEDLDDDELGDDAEASRADRA